MTRGQIAIIKDNDVFTSCEFNGDMYMPTKKWHGYGRTVTNGLKRVKDMADYQYLVAKFNKEHHHYCDLTSLVFKCSKDDLDFTKNYFDVWFSDYVYIKNLNDKPETLITKNKTFELEPGQIARICFGRLQRVSE